MFQEEPGDKVYDDDGDEDRVAKVLAVHGADDEEGEGSGHGVPVKRMVALREARVRQERRVPHLEAVDQGEGEAVEVSESVGEGSMGLVATPETIPAEVPLA